VYHALFKSGLIPVVQQTKKDIFVCILFCFEGNSMLAVVCVCCKKKLFECLYSKSTSY